MSKISLSITLVLFALLLYSCSSSLYTPTSANATGSASLETLLQGKSIYMNKCGECHRLHRPNEYDDRGWSHQVDKMQARAHISDSEKEMVYQYLISAPKKKS